MNKYGATVLVVDDEREIVRALEDSLTAHGYKVLTAKSGIEPLPKYPSFILNIPGVGYRFTDEAEQ